MATTLTPDNARAIEAAIVRELRDDAAAAGIAWGGRNDARKGSRRAHLLTEIACYRMQGKLALTRWAEHGVTYDMMRANVDMFVISPDRHRQPESAKVRESKGAL